jgi:uncharacterized protein YllA (UPF0747 family)
MPAVVPRLSLTLVEPGVAKTLARYGLDVPDFRGAVDPLWKRIALTEATVDLAGPFERARKDVEALARDLGGLAEGVAPPLAAAAGAMRQTMRHALDRLEEKTVRAEKRRHADVLARLERARAALWPAGALQERALSPLQVVARHGLAALPEIVGSVPLDSSVHHVVEV